MGSRRKFLGILTALVVLFLFLLAVVPTHTTLPDSSKDSVRSISRNPNAVEPAKLKQPPQGEDTTASSTTTNTIDPLEGWESYEELVASGEIQKAYPILEIAVTYDKDTQPEMQLSGASIKNGYAPLQKNSEEDFELQILDRSGIVMVRSGLSRNNEPTLPPPEPGESYKFLQRKDRILTKVQFAKVLTWQEEFTTARIVDKKGIELSRLDLTVIPKIESTPSFKSIRGDKFLDKIKRKRPKSSMFNFLKRLFSEEAIADVHNNTLDITILQDQFTNMQSFENYANQIIAYFLTIDPYQQNAASIRFSIVQNPNPLECVSGTVIVRAIHCNNALVLAAATNAGVPFDKIIVIVNRSDSGGSADAVGGIIATTTVGSQFRKTVVHEVAHLLDLWDEYLLDNNPGITSTIAYRNCFTGTPPASEWQGIVTSDQHFQTCRHPNWYRSSYDSLMRSLEANSFNTVSKNILVSEINRYKIANNAPTILKQPTSALLNPGESHILTVTATGSDPRVYFWTGPNQTYPNQRTIIFGGVTSPEAYGEYKVRVSNEFGSATSQIVTVYQRSPPMIIAHPQNATLIQGATHALSVTARGAGSLRYQWKKSGIDIPGATTTTLSFPNVQESSSGQYSVVVQNDFGSVTSNPATLIVGSPPQLASANVPASAPLGSSVTFSVVAQGTAPLSYRWLKDGTQISGATSNSYTIPNVQAQHSGVYSIAITNSVGSPVFSLGSFTAGGSAPLVTQHPESQSKVVGSSVSFSITATGPAPLSFQWMKDGNPLAGATSPNLNISNLQTTHSGLYVARISNSFGQVFSQSATLNVGTAPLINSHPQTSNQPVGGSVSFQVTAIGSLPINYQWMKNGTAMAGANSATLSFSNLQTSQAGDYTVRVSNSFGTIISQTARLTVSSSPPTISVQPLAQTISPTTTAASLSVTASGIGVLRYKWFKNNSQIAGASSATLALGPATPDIVGKYKCEVSNDHGAIMSREASVAWRSLPEPGPNGDTRLPVTPADFGFDGGFIGGPDGNL